MKKIFFIIVVICFGFLGCNSKKTDPGSIVKNFYNYLNNGEIEKAKECASPSAKEFIDKLSGTTTEPSKEKAPEKASPSGEVPAQPSAPPPSGSAEMPPEPPSTPPTPPQM